MTLDYTTRPISDRTQFRGRHARSPFSSAWSSTLTLLARELRELQARNMVLEMDVTESQIRVDGQVYARATPATPAVRLAFEGPAGSMQFATDRWSHWQDNVRAIALGLEALRRIERYGITRADEQYRGFRAIETSRPSAWQAEATLRRWAGPVGELRGGLHGESLARAARIGAHPDRHAGDHRPSDEVLQAIEVLGL